MRLTPALAVQLALSCTPHHWVRPLHRSDYRAALKLSRLGLVRLRWQAEFGTWAVRATPLGRWRALGGKAMSSSARDEYARR